jgi:hypothetical protein
VIWPPAAVMSFAEGAGFRGRDMVRATALALAATGGDDAWWWRPSPRLDRRGMWALTPDDAVAAGFEPGDLFHPAKAAEALRARWLSENRAWRWHPSWATRRRADAEAALSAAGTTPDPRAPVPDVLTDHRLTDTLRAARLLAHELSWSWGPTLARQTAVL